MSTIIDENKKVKNSPTTNSITLSNDYNTSQVQGGSLAILLLCVNAIVENLRKVMESKAQLAIEQAKLQKDVVESNVNAALKAGQLEAEGMKSSAIGQIVGGATSLGFTTMSTAYYAQPWTGAPNKLKTAETEMTTLNDASAAVNKKLSDNNLNAEVILKEGHAGIAPERSDAAKSAITKAVNKDSAELLNNVKNVKADKGQLPAREDYLDYASPTELATIDKHLAAKQQTQHGEVARLDREVDNRRSIAQTIGRSAQEFSQGLGQKDQADKQEDKAVQTALERGTEIAQRSMDQAKDAANGQLNETYNQIAEKLRILKEVGQEAARGG